VVAVGVATALAVAWAMSLLVRRVGRSLGFVDRPDDPDLKVHIVAAVPLGGIAVGVGFVAGWSVAGEVDWALTTLALVVVAVGLVDDRIGLPPVLRLALELAVGGAAVVTGAVPLDAGSPLHLAVGSLTIVVAINAVNLFDGLDGLAGSAGLIGFLGLAALAAARGVEVALPLVAAGALAGFLVVNWPPASVFLGDNGAYLVGFLLAVIGMRISQDGIGEESWVAGLVLGAFLLDLAVTITRRAWGRRPLFAGDRNHLYDRLHQHGWAVPGIIALAVAAQVVFVLTALTLDSSGSWWAYALTGVVGLVVVVALARPGAIGGPIG
jgi:UDP-GlcNAc:undecaprenyl-phosphate/decaprenyl-phosphate GlcNAc-1-phosphate transferase